MKQNWWLITKLSSLVNNELSANNKEIAHKVCFSYVLFVNNELIH